MPGHCRAGRGFVTKLMVLMVEWGCPDFGQRQPLIKGTVGLAHGFYEWKLEGKAKQPYYIRFKDNRCFVFAGLWDHWEKDVEHPIDSCAIITTDSISLVAPLHNRMPVILRPQNYDLWLDAKNQNIQQLTSMLIPFPSEAMEAFLIKIFVNDPRHEDPQCILPLA
jgi:putative SOS response-associated peptidase YedK